MNIEEIVRNENFRKLLEKYFDDEIAKKEKKWEAENEDM